MTLVDDVVAVPVATRLDALAPIVDELRGADAAAERERVLQYDAVHALRGTGVLSLRCRPAMAARAAASATCWPR